MLLDFSNYRYDVKMASEFYDDSTSLSSPVRSTKKPLFVIDDANHLINFYSSAFLHKNHEKAFVNFPSFNSPEADPLFYLDNAMKKNVTYRGKNNGHGVIKLS